MNKIFFQEIGTISYLKHKKELRNYLQAIFKKEKIKLDTVNIIFCSDWYLLKLNQKYLNHNYYTDTITFQLSDSLDPIFGEAYLSIDRIKSNAQKLQVSYQNELIRVIIHSCLHLCGYSDKSKKKKIEMENRQEYYHKRWLVSRETQIGG